MIRAAREDADFCPAHQDLVKNVEGKMTKKQFWVFLPIALAIVSLSVVSAVGPWAVRSELSTKLSGDLQPIEQKNQELELALTKLASSMASLTTVVETVSARVGTLEKGREINAENISRMDERYKAIQNSLDQNRDTLARLEAKMDRHLNSSAGADK